MFSPNQKNTRNITRVSPPSFIEDYGESFFYQFTFEGKSFIVSSTEKNGWGNVMISSPRNSKDLPSFSTLKKIKKIFWNRGDLIFQYYPTKNKYVNVYENCLHLYGIPVKQKSDVSKIIFHLESKNIEKELKKEGFEEKILPIGEDSIRKTIYIKEQKKAILIKSDRELLWYEKKEIKETLLGDVFAFEVSDFSGNWGKFTTIIWDIKDIPYYKKL